MTIDWKYYIVENTCIVRADLKEMHADRLLRNGDWVEFADLMDISYNGRQLATEEIAMKEARDIFAQDAELP